MVTQDPPNPGGDQGRDGGGGGGGRRNTQEPAAAAAAVDPQAQAAWMASLMAALQNAPAHFRGLLPAPPGTLDPAATNAVPPVVTVLTPEETAALHDDGRPPHSTSSW